MTKKNDFVIWYDGKIYFTWEELVSKSDCAYVNAHYFATGIKTKPDAIEIPKSKLLLILMGLDEEDE